MRQIRLLSHQILGQSLTALARISTCDVEVGVVQDNDAEVDFDDPRIARRVEQLSVDAIDSLPFGAILLDPDGRVVLFSEAESRLSGWRESAVGRDFFVDIAPCMNSAHFRGRMERAKAAGTLDLEFGHIGDFEDTTRALTVRVQSASGGGYWIFIRREVT